MRKGFSKASENQESFILKTTLIVKGNLHIVTVMPSVAADGSSCKPAVLYPGNFPHFQSVRGKFETLHDVYPHCNIYYDKSASVTPILSLIGSPMFFKKQSISVKTENIVFSYVMAKLVTFTLNF